MNVYEGTNFYEQLPVFERFPDTANLEHYYPVPDDWIVVAADIKNSTEALRAGRYKEVNVTGVSVITAINNMVGGINIPYIFGGDGAFLCIPGNFKEKAAQILSFIHQTSQKEFGLYLRTGLLPVHKIRQQGYDIQVGKFRVSDHYIQAFFRGEGLNFSEYCLKNPMVYPDYTIPEDTFPIPADYSGLECRWSHMEASEDEIISILVKAMGPDETQKSKTYREVIQFIQQLYCENLQCRPIRHEQLSLTFKPGNLSVEQRIHTSNRSMFKKLKYWIKIYIQQLTGWIFMALNWDTRETLWSAYKNDLESNSDWRKFDDILRQVLSGNTQQRKQLETYLEKRYQSGELAYGIHTSDSVIITCMIEAYQHRHFHFVDGSNGGYAEAARDLKRRLKNLKNT